MIKQVKQKTKNIFQLQLYILLIISHTLIFGCREAYINEELDADEKIPVINAVLSNVDKLSIFELYYAMPYSTYQMERISGAIIQISDNQNNSINLYEYSSGIYKPEAELNFFKSGKFYTARVELPDGSILISDEMPFYDIISIEKIYLDQNVKTEEIVATSGNSYEVTSNGLFIYVRINYDNDTTLYYRTHSIFYVQSRVNKTIEKEISVIKDNILYEYIVKTDSVFDIIEAFSNNDSPIFGTLNPDISYSSDDLTFCPLFIEADPAASNFTDYTSNTFISWIVPVDIYRHSETIYNYYADADEQLTAPNRIFDPIPSQLVGNMKNESDPDNVVLGLFDLSSVNRKYYSIKVYESYGYKYYKGNILSDTIITSGTFFNSKTIDTLLVNTSDIK